MGLICFIGGFALGVISVIVIGVGLSANTPDDDKYGGGL